MPTQGAQSRLANKENTASSHRLHGEVLLRTGSAKEAIAALEMATKKRGPDAPPIEELLLALAYLRMDKPAEARKYQKIAIAWIQRKSEPVRASALVGLAGRNPLQALVCLAVNPADPRLVPLAPRTARELTALLDEFEQPLPPPP